MINAARNMMELLKFSSLVLAAMLGVYGSFFNFKTSNNKISAHGWVCVVGILLCAITSGVLQIQSDAEDENKSMNLLRQNNQLLESTNRNLTPLSPLVVSIKLRPDLSLPTITPFIAMLESDAAELHGKIKGIPELTKNQPITSSGSQTMPAPDSRPNKAFLEATCSQNIIALFYKAPIDVDSFEYKLRPDRASDLAIDIANPCMWYSFDLPGMKDRVKNGMLSTVIVKGKVVDAYAEFDPITISGISREWVGNGQIVSVLDLLNSTMIIQLHNSSVDNREGFTRSEVGDLRRKTDLAEFVIKLPSGATLAFDEDNLTKHLNSRGEPYYVFKFPATMGELLKTTKYDFMKIIYKAHPFD